MGTDAISPLRQRMIEDMSARQLHAATQKSHIRACKRFAAFLKRSPDTATADDIRRFQLHLAESGPSICHRNRTMTGLRFLFRVTLRRLDLAAEIYHIKEPQKIPLVMSADETRRLLAVAKTLKARVLFALGYGCGLRASEVVRAQGRRYRQRPGHHPCGPVQGAQGPQCHAVAGDARSPAAMVEGASAVARHRRAAPGTLAVPGIRRGKPMTTRQLNRLFHQAADAAGIRKPVTLHSSCRRRASSATPQLRNPPAGARDRHSRDPGASRPFQIGGDGALHAGCHGHDLHRREPARPAVPNRQEREEEGQAQAGGVTRHRRGPHSSGGRGDFPRPRARLA